MWLFVKRRRGFWLNAASVRQNHLAHACFWDTFLFYRGNLMAAWAAASRAMGTRSGEQET